MLTKITIQKRKDVTVATKPTHDIVAMDDNYQNKTIIGALWTKVSPEGNKFLSGLLSLNDCISFCSNVSLRFTTV